VYATKNIEHLRQSGYERCGVRGEFQKMIAFRWMSYPLRVLAHLQLGRAFVLAGDKDRARAAYKDFLALWKDADPDIPIFTEAKAEYAKL
jgi:hypothetical protein